MPKIIFDNKSEIPEQFKDSAKQTDDGKYELDASGVFNKNKELLRDNAKLRSEKETLQAEKEAAEELADDYKKNVKVPRGQRLVSTEIAELGEAVKESGMSKEELASLKTENDEYKRKETESAKRELKTKAARAAGVTDIDLFFNQKAADAIEPEEIDGKFFITGADGKKVAFTADYLKAADGFSAVFDKLTATKQRKTPFPAHEQETTVDLATRIREQEKKRGEAEKTRTVDEAFGRTAQI